MLNCRETSKLVSESLDRKLPVGQRLSLRFHLAMCSFCRRFRKGLMQLRRRAREQARLAEETTEDDAVELSPEARERLEQAIKG